MLSGVVRMSMIVTLTGLVLMPAAGERRTEVRAGKKSGDVVCGSGVIRFNDFEGGFYGIVSDDGRRYDPVALEPSFRVPGLRVRFRLKMRQGAVGYHMWGTSVDVLEIEEVSGSNSGPSRE